MREGQRDVDDPIHELTSVWQTLRAIARGRAFASSQQMLSATHRDARDGMPLPPVLSLDMI
jgi:hypothetical protein